MELLSDVRKASQSTDPRVKTPAVVARKFRDLLVGFERPAPIPGRTGPHSNTDFDVELENLVIEVTVKNNARGKAAQILNNVTLAASQVNKPVVLFAPNFSPKTVKAVEQQGITVFRDLKLLEDFVRGQ